MNPNGKQNGDHNLLRDQDRFPQLANIGRIMRKNLPGDVKITRESKLCAQEIASEFISFVTSEAAEICSGQKRKIVNGNDIYDSLERLGFDEYLEKVKGHFDKKEAEEEAAAGRASTSKGAKLK